MGSTSPSEPAAPEPAAPEPAAPEPAAPEPAPSPSNPSSLSQLYKPENKPYRDVEHIAIAIKQVDEEQRHVGLLYKHDRAQNEVRFLHLAWHHDLRVGPPTKALNWAEPKVPQEKARILARLCKLVGEKYTGAFGKKLCYAVRYTDGRFDPNSGEFLTRDGRGLTCATFVMAMFRTYEVPLVLQDEWPKNREGDNAWHEKIVRGLTEDKADESHIEAVRNESDCARYRPEEVAAAALAEGLPAGFQFAESTGLLIVDHLRKGSPKPA